MKSDFKRGGRPNEFTVDVEEVTDESVSVAVVRIVSAYTGIEPDDLPPITEKVDPEALDDLIEPALDDSAAANTEVAFDYSGFSITVSSTGEIRFRFLGDAE